MSSRNGTPAQCLQVEPAVAEEHPYRMPVAETLLCLAEDSQRHWLLVCVPPAPSKVPGIVSISGS